MITLIDDGKEYTLVGYQPMRTSDYYVTFDKEIRQFTGKSTSSTAIIVKPVPIEHTFGGVVFEETGEKLRRLAVDEWGILVETGSAVCGAKALIRLDYLPIRPVRLA